MWLEQGEAEEAEGVIRAPRHVLGSRGFPLRAKEAKAMCLHWRFPQSALAAEQQGGSGRGRADVGRTGHYAVQSGYTSVA